MEPTPAVREPHCREKRLHRPLPLGSGSAGARVGLSGGWVGPLKVEEQKVTGVPPGRWGDFDAVVRSLGCPCARLWDKMAWKVPEDQEELRGIWNGHLGVEDSVLRARRLRELLEGRRIRREGFVWSLLIRPPRGASGKARCRVLDTEYYSQVTQHSGVARGMRAPEALLHVLGPAFPVEAATWQRRVGPRSVCLCTHAHVCVCTTMGAIPQQCPPCSVFVLRQSFTWPVSHQ